MRDWWEAAERRPSEPLAFSFLEPSSQLGHVFWYLFLFVLCLSFQAALATKDSRNRKDTCHSPIIKIADDYDFWEYQGSTNNTYSSTWEKGNGDGFSLICLNVFVIIFIICLINLLLVEYTLFGKNCWSLILLNTLYLGGSGKEGKSYN